MKSHKDLDVWQSAIDLAKATYRLTSEFPREEQFGLVSQMRRSAVSVASNIPEISPLPSRERGGGEGAEWQAVSERSVGSASELDTQLEIAVAIGFDKQGKLLELQNSLGAVSRMLQGLIRTVKQRSTHQASGRGL